MIPTPANEGFPTMHYCDNLDREGLHYCVNANFAGTKVFLVGLFYPLRARGAEVFTIPEPSLRSL